VTANKWWEKAKKILETMAENEAEQPVIRAIDERVSHDACAEIIRKGYRQQN
jgi:hypothetical protein